MRGNIMIALVAFLLILILGCNGPDRNSSPGVKDTVGGILDSGELRVGYLVFDPCVIRDPRSGELSGFFVDAIRELSKDLKLKPVFVETTLKDFAAGLQSGKFDMSIGPTFRTIGRSSSVSFSDPLAYIGNSAVARAVDRDKYPDLASLNKSGVRIAVLQGQAMEAFAKQHLPKAELISLGGDQGLTAPLVAVSAGRADVGMSNSVTVYRYVQEQPGLVDLYGDQPLEVTGLCWSVRPDDIRLLNMLNDSIGYLRDTGRLKEYQLRYRIPCTRK